MATLILVLIFSNTVTAMPTNETINSSVKISGTVLRCDNGEPFSDVNITAAGNETILATNTTDAGGNYILNFTTTLSTFQLTASYPGHKSATQNVTTGTDIVNFQLGSVTDDGTVPTLISGLATFVSLGNYANIWIHYYGGNQIAGVLNMNYNGVIYPSFCIDLYKYISIGNSLLVNGALTDSISDQVDWCKVNYIIHNYNPTNSNEAGAIQAAIWYFTTAPYGAYPGTTPPYYQFMTYSGGPPNDGDPVRARALQIISETNAAGCMSYPVNITLVPETASLPNGQSLQLTATVYDQHGNPLPGMTVIFQTSIGILSASTGITDSNGQVKVNLTTNGLYDTAATIQAWVEGQYGTLLYDPGHEKQSLTTTTLIPHSIMDVSLVNFIPAADLRVTKTISDPRPLVGDTIYYTIIVQNRGPNTAVNVRVNDIIPAGLTYVSSTANYGSYNPNTGIWTIGNLPNGAVAQLVINSVVLRPGDITNQAKVISETYDPNLEGNTASAAMDVQAPTVPVNAQTIGMQPTGAPFVGLIVALLILFVGIILPRRK